MTEHDSAPSAERPRSYSGGYMKVGREAEEKVLAWLRRQAWIVEVQDVRQHPRYQTAEIDFVVCERSGRKTPIEIKSDRHLGHSGNWLFELHRINLNAPPERKFVQGWSIRSKAERLCVFSPAAGSIHIIRMEHYRAAFLSAVRESEYSLISVPTDSIKRTLNALFPAHYVEVQPSYVEIVP